MDDGPGKKSGDASDPPASGKRPRDASDSEADKPEAKKPCLEESTPLEGDLSDISDDDADEILNREDSVSSASFFQLRALTTRNANVIFVDLMISEHCIVPSFRGL